jgi:hypothetical protein
MYCPKCGIENPDNAKVCNSCNHVLISTPISFSNPETKTCGLAIASFVLGILSFLFFPAIPAIILGIISLAKIRKSAGQLKGTVLAVLGIIIPVVWLPLLLIPALSNVRSFSLEVKQKAQFNSINVAIELFNSEFEAYPDSNAKDPTGKPYCGAMKFAEAMMGQDLKGFHYESIFRSDGKDSNEKLLYNVGGSTIETYFRKGPYLPIEIANVYRLNEIFENAGPFDGNKYVICDVFTKKRHSGKKTGMPVLYYKAYTSKKSHDLNNPDNPDNIYNYKDNHALLALGVPGQPGKKHPLFEDPTIFYKMTKDQRSTSTNTPIRADSFIMISAGKDGLYGTQDDILNFDF